MPRDRPSAGGQDSTSGGKFAESLQDKPEGAERVAPRQATRFVAEPVPGQVGPGEPGQMLFRHLNNGGVTFATSAYVTQYLTSNYSNTTTGSAPIDLEIQQETTALGYVKGFLSATVTGETKDLILEFNPQGAPRTFYGGPPFRGFFTYPGSVFQYGYPNRGNIPFTTVAPSVEPGGAVFATFYVNEYNGVPQEGKVSYYDGTSLTTTTHPYGRYPMLTSGPHAFRLLDGDGSLLTTGVSGVSASFFGGNAKITGYDTVIVDNFDYRTR